MNDVIKRKDAIGVIWECTPFDAEGIRLLDRCEEKIRAIPSADRPQGEWLDYKDEHTCSVCKEVVIDDWYYEDEWYDFCPHCGARMKGANDEISCK